MVLVPTKDKGQDSPVDFALFLLICALSPGLPWQEMFPENATEINKLASP